MEIGQRRERIPARLTDGSPRPSARCGGFFVGRAGDPTTGKFDTTEKSRKFGADSHDKYGITAQAHALPLWIGGKKTWLGAVGVPRGRARAAPISRGTTNDQASKFRRHRAVGVDVVGLVQRLHGDGRRAESRPVVLSRFPCRPISRNARKMRTGTSCVISDRRSWDRLRPAPGSRAGSAVGRRGDAETRRGPARPRRRSLAARGSRETTSAS